MCELKFKGDNNFKLINSISKENILEISGKILDQNTGAPIEEATVKVMDNLNKTIKQVKTNSNGEFSIGGISVDYNSDNVFWGTYSVEVKKDGYRTVIILSHNGAIIIDNVYDLGIIELSATGPIDPIITPTISGIVKDADTDKPIEGVTVYLNCIFGAGGEDLAARCETAADGTFTMDIPQSENITGISSIEFQKDGYNSYRLSLDSSTNFSLGTIKLVPIDSSIDSSLYTFEIEEDQYKRIFTTTSSGDHVVALTYQISTNIPDFDASNVQWTTTSTVTDLQTDGQNAVVTTNRGFTITASYTYNGYTYTCDYKGSSLIIHALLNSVQW